MVLVIVDIEGFLLLGLFLAFASYLALSWQFSVEIAALFFAVFLIHELGHAVAIKMIGEEVVAIRFVPFLGAITVGSQPKNALTEAIVALGGTTVSFLAAMVLFTVPYVFGWPIDTGVEDGRAIYSSGALAHKACSAVLIINLVQLLPVSPLDGSKVVTAMLSGLSKRISLAFVLVATASSAVLLFLTKSYLFGFLAVIAVVLLLAQFKTPASLPYTSATKKQSALIGGLYAAHVLSFSTMFAILAFLFLQQTAEKKGKTVDELINYAFCIAPQVFTASEGDILELDHCGRL